MDHPRLTLTPDAFRAIATRAVDLLARYLEQLPELPSFPSVTGAQTRRLFEQPLPEQGLGAAALDDLDDVLACSRPPSPRFFGYVLGSGDPVGAVADLVASVLNQNVTAWRSAPAAVAIERTVVGALAEAVGCPGWTGSLTGGGSSANLMALAMARDASPAPRSGRIYASAEVHMSILKAAALLGLGTEAVRLVPVDASFRMLPEELDRAIRRDRSAGDTPLAIVASAGTVSTGSIDPLEAIAEVAGEHETWLHVDGAYGALAALAIPEAFRGLARARSLSLDPHKWLYQPLDCGCLLYADPGPARASFAHSGDYARSLLEDPYERFAFFEESIELSRRFRALRLWLSLRYHGLDAFRQAIRADLELARHLGRAIEAQPTLELLAPIALSAVCFRHRGRPGASVEEVDRLNADLLRRIVARGRVFLSNATIHGRFALRACIVNHRSTAADVEAIVTETLEAAGASA